MAIAVCQGVVVEVYAIYECLPVNSTPYKTRTFDLASRDCVTVQKRRLANARPEGTQAGQRRRRASSCSVVRSPATSASFLAVVQPLS